MASVLFNGFFTFFFAHAESEDDEEEEEEEDDDDDDEEEEEEDEEEEPDKNVWDIGPQDAAVSDNYCIFLFFFCLFCLCFSVSCV